MKATTLWNPPNEGATNSSGFTAFGGGVRNINGSFGYMGIYGFWWSSTTWDGDVNEAFMRDLVFDAIYVDRYTSKKGTGTSVRYVRD